MNRVQLTEKFFLDEFDCHDGTPVPPEFIGNVRDLGVGILQPLRTRFGEALIVVCGYRTHAHNIAVKGAADSAHLTAQAADIRPASLAKVAELHALALSMYQRGELPALGGIGNYPMRWIHVDTRILVGHLRRWDGNSLGSEPVFA